jgi:hypothetical protein
LGDAVDEGRALVQFVFGEVLLPLLELSPGLQRACVDSHLFSDARTNGAKICEELAKMVTSAVSTLCRGGGGGGEGGGGGGGKLSAQQLGHLLNALLSLLLRRDSSTPSEVVTSYPGRVGSFNNQLILSINLLIRNISEALSKSAAEAKRERNGVDDGNGDGNAAEDETDDLRALVTVR